MSTLFSATIDDLSRQVLAEARARGIKVVTAESCTGGLVGGALTDIAGSSDVFERGYITYSNVAKMQVLGVPDDILKDHGAVSMQCASAMAHGALRAAAAGASVAITGIAGPGGGSAAKPVGLVHFAAATPSHKVITLEKRFGDAGRTMVRLLSVETALGLLLSAIRQT
ncbi:MAG TPA: damage-inducible protein CinA [Alphaproteobacteria bacterium]|nr:damage-inducible protein CinA [Alphaproteobacteria bacterium]HAJ45415.1 damage-inducible protein CinA [Alphaproteobacteria bacterium]